MLFCCKKNRENRTRQTKVVRETQCLHVTKQIDAPGARIPPFP